MSDDLTNVQARNVREDMRVDLEGDPFLGDDPIVVMQAENEYAIVVGFEVETASCIRVDFDFVSIGFPLNHPLRVVTSSIDTEG